MAVLQLHLTLYTIALQLNTILCTLFGGVTVKPHLVMLQSKPTLYIPPCISESTTECITLICSWTISACVSTEAIAIKVPMANMGYSEYARSTYDTRTLRDNLCWTALIRNRELTSCLVYSTRIKLSVDIDRYYGCHRLLQARKTNSDSVASY